jgi:cytochrome c biogenesis protein CcmG/thiol:disulfide interchange protein DsbE
VRIDQLTRRGMLVSRNHAVRYLSLGMILVMFISACSAGERIAPETSSDGSAEGQLPSSARMMGDLPKSVQGGNEELQANNAAALQMPSSNDGVASAKAAAGLPLDASQNPQEQVQVPLGGGGSQPPVNEALPAPEVDLSLPAGPQVGLRAPDFTLQTLDGGPLGLSDLLGNPVVISYWATWCVPCKNELGILTRIFPEYQRQGLQVVTINAIEQDSLDKIQTAVVEMGMEFPVMLDEGNQFSQIYQAVFFPTTIYVDGSGVIRHIALGDSSEADFRMKIEQLLTGGL